MGRVGRAGFLVEGKKEKKEKSLGTTDKSPNQRCFIGKRFRRGGLFVP